jgi:AcrR family transcriptional regulator
MAHSTSAHADEPRSTYDSILDVAERRFAERGFSAVSMREISAEVGLKNQASLYHHFRNKRALYEAVLARGVERIVAFVAESATDATSRDRGLEHVVDYLAEHPHLPRLIQRAGLDDSRHLAKALNRLLYPLYAQGMQVLSSKATSWKSEELPHLAAGLYHLIFGYFANTALFEAVMQENLESPEAMARQRRFVKAAVGRLLDPEATPARPRILAPKRKDPK